MDSCNIYLLLFLFCFPIREVTSNQQCGHQQGPLFNLLWPINNYYKGIIHIIMSLLRYENYNLNVCNAGK